MIVAPTADAVKILVRAKEDVTELEALVAKLAVPSKDPVAVPVNDPEKDPECVSPEALLVATIVPVPLMAVVVKLEP